jgi:2-dehydro-3-deoxygalactonokinase
MTSATIRAVGIDWGTTHRRGYAIDAGGHCVAEVADTRGMLAARGHFEAALDELLAALGVRDATTPIVMSGMVGSAQGWMDAGYLDAPLPLTRLRERLVPVPGTGGRAAIVPGVALRRDGQVDVMRGEETQLLGAHALGHGNGWFALPGTHGKWVRVEGGAIVDMATYLTGELFALLAAQGTLAAAIGDGDDGGHDDAAFAQGLATAGEGGALSHALFGLRARIVTGALPARHGRSYLSGLLIGAEWRDLRRRCGGHWPASVTVIASPTLVARHADAARALGVALQVVDARAAYLAALPRLVDGYRD